MEGEAEFFNSKAVSFKVYKNTETPTVASWEIETTVFDPASQFLSNISRRA